MATGTIKTINQTEKASILDPKVMFAPGTTGIVTQDESGTEIDFYDENFPSTGLKEGDRCSFTIEFDPSIYAHNFAPLTVAPVVIDISAPQVGDVTVPDNTTVRVKNGGKITGNIIVSGGTLIVGQGGAVEGDVNLDAAGSAIVRNAGSIKGNIIVNNGGTLKVVNNGSVKGNINVIKGYRVILGGSEGTGSLTGALTVQKTKKVSVDANFKINCA